MNRNMSRRPWAAATASALASILLAGGAVAQGTPQTPPQDPPKPQPEQQDPEELRRQEQERERQRLEQERLQQERIQQARQQEEQKRAGEARLKEEERLRQARQQQGGTAREASAPVGAPRAVARQLLDIERKHRALTARMDRISEIYRQQGKAEELRQLDELRQAQNQRYMSAQSRFQEQLGPRGYAKMQTILQQAAQRREQRQGREETPPQRQNR